MCKEKEITVLKVSPHKKPEVDTLKNELSALQEAVSSGVKDYHHLIQLVGVEGSRQDLCANLFAGSG